MLNSTVQFFIKKYTALKAFLEYTRITWLPREMWDLCMRNEDKSLLYSNLVRNIFMSLWVTKWCQSETFILYSVNLNWSLVAQ